MPVIDAHVHLYSPDEWRYPPRSDAWRPEPGVGSLAHLLEEFRENGVDKAVHLNTLSFYGFDNRYLLDVAKSQPSRIAAVCLLSGQDPRGPYLLEEYLRDFGIRGVRLLPISTGQLDQPGIRTLWQKAAELGLVVNVLAGSEHGRDIRSLVGSFPNVPTVIEHSLSMHTSVDRKATLRELIGLAKFSNVHVELNDLPVLSRTSYPFEDVFPTYARIIDAFGSDRCLWGSSFPTQFWAPQAPYSESLRAFQTEIPIEQEAREDILGNTAQRLWFDSNTNL